MSARRRKYECHVIVYFKNAQRAGGSPGDSVLARSSLALMIGVKKETVQRRFCQENDGNKYQSQDVMWFEDRRTEKPTDVEKRRVKDEMD